MIQEIKLKLGSEERRFTFGIIFLGNVLETLELDYNSMLMKVSKNPFKYAPILMTESLNNTARKERLDASFTLDSVVDWLESEDVMGVDIMLKFIHAFIGTNDNPTPTEDSAEGDVKKK
tara:strand:+ start:37 stop:393 length:357 start_codon:yes stop_codon:yes gene_type:complete